MNRQLGYDFTRRPSSIATPQFYWNCVAPHIQTEIRYLKHGRRGGRQWIGSLYGNVFRAEREYRCSGPQDLAGGRRSPSARCGAITTLR